MTVNGTRIEFAEQHVSAANRAAIHSRNRNFCTFPDAVIGNASTTSIRSDHLGFASPASCIQTWTSPTVRVESPAASASRITQAQMRSPSRGSGMPTTAAFATFGCANGTLSISTGAMFTPPRTARTWKTEVPENLQPFAERGGPVSRPAPTQPP